MAYMATSRVKKLQDRRTTPGNLFRPGHDIGRAERHLGLLQQPDVDDMNDNLKVDLEAISDLPDVEFNNGPDDDVNEIYNEMKMAQHDQIMLENMAREARLKQAFDMRPVRVFFNNSKLNYLLAEPTSMCAGLTNFHRPWLLVATRMEPFAV